MIGLGKVFDHTRAWLRRAILWPVYQVSPRLYWNFRSRELHEHWFPDDADYHFYREFILTLNAHTCLEIGCNGGRFSRHLVNDVERLECQDVSARALEICRESIGEKQHGRVTFRCGEITHLYSSFPDAHFDLVISNRVLSAVQKNDIAATLATLTRISKHVIINELMSGDRGATYYWFAHDYDRLFAELDMICKREVVSGDQRFRVYSHGAGDNSDKHGSELHCR